MSARAIRRRGRAFGAPAPAPTPAPSGPPWAAGTPLWVLGDSNTDFSYGIKANWVRRMLNVAGARAWIPPGAFLANGGASVFANNGNSLRAQAELAAAQMAAWPGPKLAWFQIGTNASNGGDLSQEPAELAAAVAVLRAAGAAVVANTCPFNKGNPNQPRFVAINDVIRGAGNVDAYLNVNPDILAEFTESATHYNQAQQTAVGDAAAALLATLVEAGAPYATNAAPLLDGETSMAAGFPAASGTGWSGVRPAGWSFARTAAGNGALAVLSETVQGGQPALRIDLTGGTAGAGVFELSRPVGNRLAGDLGDAYARIALAANGAAPLPETVDVSLIGGNGHWPAPPNTSLDIPTAAWAGPVLWRTYGAAYSAAAANDPLTLRAYVQAGQAYSIIISEVEFALRGTSTATAPAALTAPVMDAAIEGGSPDHTPGTYSGAPAPGVAFAYYLDDGADETAIASGYVFQAVDIGRTVFVRESATNVAGSVTQVSAAVSVQAAADVTAPTITSAAAVNVAENAQLAHALTANEAVTWSIRTAAEAAASADAAQFELSGATLRWTANGTRNFEAPADAGADNGYLVMVRATDAAGNTADQLLTVTVGDVTEDLTAPTITSAAAVNVAENAQLAHALAANEAVSWSIRTAAQDAASADAAQFELNGATLRWTANGTRDFEAPADAGANNGYVVVIRATDAAGNTTDQAVTVTVTDAAEALSANSGWNEAVTASGVTYPSPTVVQSTATAVRTARGETGRGTGKRFAVVQATAGGTSAIGVGSAAAAGNNNAASAGANGTERVVWLGSAITATGGNVTGQASVDDGVPVQIAVDLDAKLIWFRKGTGLWNAGAGANPATGAGGLSISGLSGLVYPVAALKATGPFQATLSTSEAEFAALGIAAPAGFLPWEVAYPDYAPAPKPYPVKSSGTVIGSSANDAVTNRNALNTAVGAAQPGDHILLAANANFGFVSPLARVMSPPIVIRSADPAQPAIFDGGTNRAFRFQNWTGVYLMDLLIRATAIPNAEAFNKVGQFDGCTNVGVFGCRVIGTIGSGNDRLGEGITFINSTGCRVAGCVIEDSRYGVVGNHVADLEVIGNDFRRMGFDGVQTRGTVGLRIYLNIFDALVWDPGAHADAWQDFTTGATRKTREAVFWKNFVDCDTELPILLFTDGVDKCVGRFHEGIYTASEVLAMRADDVVIADNDLYGVCFNGAYVTSTNTRVKGVNKFFHIRAVPVADDIVACAFVATADSTGSFDTGSVQAHQLALTASAMTNKPTQVPNPNPDYVATNADRIAARAVWRTARLSWLG